MKNKTEILGIFIALLSLFSFSALAASSSAEIVIDLNCPRDQMTGQYTANCPETQKIGDKLVSPITYNFSDIFAIDVKLKNPSKSNIISAETWLSYDKNVLEGIRIDTSPSFDLVAPGEKEFDAQNGLAKIGVASIRGGVNSEEIVAATVVFKVISSASKLTSIKFYDYKLSEIGHTNANIMENNIPVNILSPPPLSFDIPLNGGLPAGGPPPQAFSEPAASLTLPPASSSLIRPMNLRGDTFNSDVYLKWDNVPGNVKGYFLYYSNVSGQYLRRKDAKKNEVYINNLQIGRPYFFAVTAYDKNGIESDYSDEIMIIVGQAGSSTSPILNTDLLSYKKMRATNDTGLPTSVILLVVFTVGSFTYLLIWGLKKTMPLEEYKINFLN